MKKYLSLLFMLSHKYAWSATVAAGAGYSAGFLSELARLNPEIWAFSTFGAVFVYMNHKVAKRNRLVNLALSIILGAFGSDVSASYIRKTFEVDSGFLTVLMALLISATWPWIFEKFVGVKK